MNHLPCVLNQIIISYCFGMPEDIFNEIKNEIMISSFDLSFSSRGQTYNIELRRHVYVLNLNYFCSKCGNIFIADNTKVTGFSNRVICLCGDNRFILNTDIPKHYKRSYIVSSR